MTGNQISGTRQEGLAVSQAYQSHDGLLVEREDDEQVLLAGSVPLAPADQIRKEEKSTWMDTDEGGAGPVSRCWREEDDG